MNGLNVVEKEKVDLQTAGLLEAVEKKLGLVPNMVKAMANSPAVVEAYVNFSGAMGKSKLSPKLKELIAITVAEVNQCGYCLSAHSFIAKKLGVSEAETDLAREGVSKDPKTAAALRFVYKIVELGGHLDDAEYVAIREAGYTDTEIAELVGITALNVFTNFFNETARTPIDFPLAKGIQQR